MENRSKCWYEEVCQRYGENCQNMCIRYKEMRYLMDNSNLPPKKQWPLKLDAPECDLDAKYKLLPALTKLAISALISASL